MRRNIGQAGTCPLTCSESGKRNCAKCSLPLPHVGSQIRFPIAVSPESVHKTIRSQISGGWFDAFGDLFMAISSKSGRQVNGQFFTQPDIEPADAFIYRNESFTLYSREELERLVGILHGELFNGFRPGLFILWAYRMEWKELPTWEWNMLKAETHLFFLGVSPVKIRTDHNGHTVTFYKKTEQYDTL